jgi:hypothetical protein
VRRHNDLEHGTWFEFASRAETQSRSANLFDDHIIRENFEVCSVSVYPGLDRDLVTGFESPVIRLLFRVSSFGEQVVVARGTNLSITEVGHCHQLRKMGDVYYVARFLIASVA